MLRVIQYILSLLVLVINIAACSPNSELIVTDSRDKILFVGNSFTFINGGIEAHVRELAASAVPTKFIQVESKTRAGATLAIHYRQSDVLEAIRDGAYDVVILQGDIPELTEQSIRPFLEYARLFDQEIKDAGAKTMFFMTWPYERLSWITLEEIVEAHSDISTELNASVAPVGLAFQRALAKRPSLDMLIGDKEHESIHGTYLAASVIYSSLFGESPVGLPYAPTEVSTEESAFLQGIAWETVQKWSSRR